jgi:AcrR family transcriptional regulator
MSAPANRTRTPDRTPTGRPSRRHATVKSAETRDAIIAATLRCFHRDGYFRTNMSTVAKEAGVTRGCMQYYFPTTEALLETAAEHLVRKLWDRHARALMSPPPGSGQMEHAIDNALKASLDPNYQVLVELLAAARTEPMLRPIVLQAMKQFDTSRLKLSAQVFQDEARGHDPALRTASDLVSVLAAGLALYVFPDDAAGRTANLSAAAKGLMMDMIRQSAPEDAAAPPVCSKSKR